MADKKILVNVDFGGSSSIKNLPSATPASSDCLAITDDSDGGKVKKGPSFGTNDGTFLRKDGTWAGLGGTTISANATPIVTFKKSATSSGSFIGFKPNNQDNSVWLTGVTSALAYRFSYSSNGGTTVTKKMELDTNGNLEVVGTISEAGTALSSKYLGISSTAADSSKLNGQAASYYLNYDNLTNKPTIPAAQVNADWNATSGVAKILNKPTIPTVNNGTLTIQKNGTQVATFSANQSSNATANITVPTKDSDITNDRYVRYDTNAQGLTATQKTNARTNIGAGTSNLTLGNTASTAAAGNHNHNADYLSITGGELTTDKESVLTLYDKSTNPGSSYLDYKFNGQDQYLWRIGVDGGDKFFHVYYSDTGGATYHNMLLIDNSANLKVEGSIYESGTALSSKYLGISGTAADSSKLNGQNPSYYLNYNNFTNKPTIPSVSNATITVKQTGRADQTFTLNGSATTINLDNTTYSAATTSANGLMSSTDKTKLDGIATGATKVIESTVSGWGFTKNAGTVTKVDSVSPSSGNVALSAVRYVSQSLTDAQKSQARSNIGAGTSSLAIGTTANTAAAGNHNHDSTYLKLSGGTLTGTNPLLTLKANAASTSAKMDFKPNNQNLKTWQLGASSAYWFTVAYSADGSTFNDMFELDPSGNFYVAGSLYEGSTAISNKYLALAGGTMTGNIWTSSDDFHIGQVHESDHGEKLTIHSKQIRLATPDDYLNYSTALEVFNDGYNVGIRSLMKYYDDPESSYSAAGFLVYGNTVVYPHIKNSAITGTNVYIGTGMHCVKLTYSTSIIVRFNVRSPYPGDSKCSNYSQLASLLYNSGYRSQATALHCSGRYTNYQYCVTGIYASSSTQLVLVYVGTSGISENTININTGATVADTLLTNLVP